MLEIPPFTNTMIGKTNFPPCRVFAVPYYPLRASQIRENLHVILCFSPMAPEFRNRARKFPALVSCTVIDWFQPWPKEALASVGTRFMAKSIYLDGEGVRAGVEQFMINSFEGVNTMCTKVGRSSAHAMQHAHSHTHTLSICATLDTYAPTYLHAVCSLFYSFLPPKLGTCTPHPSPIWSC